MSDQETRRRVIIWHTLSDLFKDAPIKAADHEALARRLNAVGCGAQEGEAMLHDEVAPVFAGNFDKSTGAKGWTDAEVRWLVAEFLRRPAPVQWLRRWKAKRNRFLYEPNWQKIALRLSP